MCKTTIFPLVGRDGDKPRGVIVLMDEQPESARKGNGDGAGEKDTSAAKDTAGQAHAPS
jgi:hypothetical protein